MAEAPSERLSYTSGFLSMSSKYGGLYGQDDDPFANFSFTPPRQTGRFRSFSRRNRYQAQQQTMAAMASLHASRERLSGSNTNLSCFGSGSTQDLTLDTGKMMNLAEDARSRKISAEIMKHRLYDSVITSPRRRRFSMRAADYYGHGQTSAAEHDMPHVRNIGRYIQSLPVTPAHSENVTPIQSPTSSRRVFGFFSRGTTPDEEQRCLTETVEEDNWKGLASLLRPQPRYMSSLQRYGNEENEDAENRLRPSLGRPGIYHRYQNDEGGGGGLVLQEMQDPSHRACAPPPCPVSERDMNDVEPTSF